MTSDKLAKLEAVLKAIGRDAQTLEDFETADSIGRSVQFALELLADITAEDCEELPAGIAEPLAA